MSDGRESVRELDAARWRVALGLTAAMVVLYFGFVLLVAYGWPLLAEQVVPGLTLGISWVRWSSWSPGSSPGSTSAGRQRTTTPGWRR